MGRFRNHMQARGERGQGFMELAVSLVFLLILLSVVIELGWAFYEFMALRDIAQEAASFAAICPPVADTATHTYPLIDENELIWDRVRLSAATPLNTNDLAYNPAETIRMFRFASGSETEVFTPQYGDRVQITLTYGHAIKAPFVGRFVGSQNYTLTARVSNTIMRENCIRETAPVP